MKKIYLILAAVCLLLSLAACQTAQAPDSIPEEPSVTAPEEAPEPAPEPEPDPSLSQRDRDWIEDIEYLRTEYRTKHLDPFYLVPEEEFDWRIDRLITRVSELSDEDIYFEIAAIIAGMGDLHTTISASEALSDSFGSRLFPIRVQYFGGKLYLCGYQEGYEQFMPYLLREIVAVNGIDISYLEKKAQSVAKPFNNWASQETFSQRYFFPAFFDWAGCDYQEGYTLQILNDNQEAVSLELPVIPQEIYDEGNWVWPENWGRLYCGKSGDWAEYIEGEDGSCIYMHYVNLASPAEIMAVFNTTATLIGEHPECGKLVIDLRDHPGGSADRVPMVRTCTKQLDAPSIEQTYVITGGRTASGAIDCLGLFQDILDAVIIGEPTAQFSSFFYAQNSSAQITLPHSQLSGWISNGWYETAAAAGEYYDEDGRLYPWESAILPDVYLYQDIEDIRQGRDSVLEWVLAQ